jgi:transcriptional regulator with XRE-family HTH domain
MNINQKVAAKIHEIRTQKNILQSAVAESLDISQNAYSMLENGTTRITIQKIFMLAEYFKVPVSKILDIGENTCYDFQINNQTIEQANPQSTDTNSQFYERIIDSLNKTIASQNETILLLKEKG